MVEVLGRYSKLASLSKRWHSTPIRAVPVAPRGCMRWIVGCVLRLGRSYWPTMNLVYRLGSTASLLPQSGQHPAIAPGIWGGSALPSHDGYRDRSGGAAVFSRFDDCGGGGESWRPCSTVQTALTRRGVTMRTRHDYV